MATKNEVKATSKKMVDIIIKDVDAKVNEGILHLPGNYSVGNALKVGYLRMQEAVNFDKATDKSKAEALLDMALMGHNATKHGYFIVYGTRMTWFPSYLGKMATIKRALGITITAQPIYEKDEFVYDLEDGIYSNLSHKQKLENLEDPIIGGYAIAKNEDGEIVRCEVMTMRQIKESWSKSKTNKDHKEHQEEYVRRTLFNRISKYFLKTSDDSDLLMDTAVSNEEKHYEYDRTVVEGEVHEPKQIDFDDETGEVQEVEVIQEEQTDAEPQDAQLFE